MSNQVTPSALAATLGLRLKRARLNRDFTQDELAQKAGLARKTVAGAERGKVQLENFVAILLALGLSDQLDLFLPEQTVSPRALAKLQGKQRQRASGKGRRSRAGGATW
ncbi:MAG: transcriptional regulator [Gammaproteobacteria bacterium]|nr:MAG: transcriptional regulator [Gammaproteobacteria bacterium]